MNHTGACKITVCICTFQRAALLKRLLEHLERQETQAAFSFNIVVADNDAKQGAKAVVAEFAKRSALAVSYICEPRQNIALARNAAVKLADGDFIAFIDDDEFPRSDWLFEMRRVCAEYGAAGVLAPVRPHFDDEPARWIVDGGFFERPEHPTGRVMSWTECRTGNVLLRRTILEGLDEPFRPQFGTGGEDIDFFCRMTQAGAVFHWCREGAVHETVPKDRCSRAYLFKRALLRGRNNMKLSTGKAGMLARSAIAAPAYFLLLPATLPFGQHVFMKYSIKFCDHAGRLLALVGLNPVSQR